ncbi:Predicted DNA-binding transcriptional regulator YafY, contains an HTH and WYL domains [Brevibacterium aurantiacum]|uniref:Predicted DNA-binding transcriptional regulator YafY, contains an HTH and WYL domains n=2 Tax=Brevibacterium aurantiacum TaxID=273384 RepID=A0A2H1K1E1_BREAU|nr:Predicted DNA-binding transcriptional regulator YafY, contains an HTH and WYL domains [Brevibacterium aurantiacum]SMX93540.1 Predicted DNA-binding transcriptional regulator YafY, contains an HTH and WYL domains [Brevibacterium aurantiacum]
MTADELARELEVSARTVLRDIDALSTSGVPVYADRGRHGGYSLLPGFRAELTGLSHQEALALLTAGSGKTEKAFGLSSALASAMRKVIDALPEDNRATLDDAAARLLVEPEADLLSRSTNVENAPTAVTAEVLQSVLSGHRLRFLYEAPDKAVGWHTVDPIGLVTIRDRTYLLATKAGADRTYRLSRMLEAEELPEPADRPDQVDLDRIWDERRTRFLSEGHISVTLRIDPTRRGDLLTNVRAVLAEMPEPDGWIRLEVTYEDLRHARWAIWQLDTAAEALSPEELRTSIREHAEELLGRYSDSSTAK